MIRRHRDYQQKPHIFKSNGVWCYHLKFLIAEAESINGARELWDVRYAYDCNISRSLARADRLFAEGLSCRA